MGGRIAKRAQAVSVNLKLGLIAKATIETDIPILLDDLNDIVKVCVVEKTLFHLTAWSTFGFLSATSFPDLNTDLSYTKMFKPTLAMDVPQHRFNQVTQRVLNDTYLITDTHIGSQLYPSLKSGCSLSHTYIGRTGQ